MGAVSRRISAPEEEAERKDQLLKATLGFTHILLTSQQLQDIHELGETL